MINTSHPIFGPVLAGIFLAIWTTGLCNRRGSKTLETAHPEKPTPSGFRAKNYKIRLG